MRWTVLRWVRATNKEMNSGSLHVGMDSRPQVMDLRDEGMCEEEPTTAQGICSVS